MKKTKRAETLVVVMVSVIILSFIAMSLFSILDFDRSATKIYAQNINELILRSNNENIIKKISTKNILEGESFYILKDTENKEYKIFTGTNEQYKNINNLGNCLKLNNTDILPSYCEDLTGNENLTDYKLGVFQRIFKKNGNIIRDDDINSNLTEYNNISVNITKEN